MIRLTVELTPEQAAGLARFCEKSGFDNVLAVLYTHLDREIRGDQAHSILEALAKVEKALADANVRSWPWIDTGRAS